MGFRALKSPPVDISWELLVFNPNQWEKPIIVPSAVDASSLEVPKAKLDEAMGIQWEATRPWQGVGAGGSLRSLPTQSSYDSVIHSVFL